MALLLDKGTLSGHSAVQGPSRARKLWSNGLRGTDKGPKLRVLEDSWCPTMPYKPMPLPRDAVALFALILTFFEDVSSYPVALHDPHTKLNFFDLSFATSQ